MSSIIKSASVTRVADFGDIAAVAKQEKHRIFGPDPEPLEIQLLRMQAADEAREMVHDAFNQADQIREEARQEGWQEGYSAGHAVALEDAARRFQIECENLTADLQLFVDRVDEERRRIWREAEPQIMAFVLEIARKVVKDEAKVNRDVILSVVRNSLRRVVDTENIRIRVNMDDLDTVRSSRDELTSLVDGIRHIEIVDDRRVNPGGCVVETGSGTIDAKMDTQLDEVTNALQAMINEAA